MSKIEFNIKTQVVTKNHTVSVSDLIEAVAGYFVRNTADFYNAGVQAERAGKAGDED